VNNELSPSDLAAFHDRLVEVMDAAVVVTDDAFVVTAWNAAAEALYGWRADEVLGRHVRDVFSSDMSEAARVAVRQQTTAEGSSRLDVVTQRKDGTPIDVELIDVAVHGPDGNVAGYFGIHREITESRRVEREQQDVHDARRDVTTVLERITDAFYALDGDWNLTYINARAVVFLAQLRGEARTRDQLIGRNIWELFPALVGSEAYKTVHQALQDQRAADFELQYPDADVWLGHRVYPPAGGLSVYFRDVTARVQADVERRQWARQQAQVADFGRRALMTDDLQALMNEAVRLVAVAVDVEVVRIGEVLPGGADLAIRAGLGLAHGVASSAREPLEGTAAAFALALDQDVVSDDLDLEQRFAPVRLAADLAPHSAAAVLIRRPRRAFGVLEAQAGRALAFSATDLNFMKAVANILGTVAERGDAERRVRAVREFDRRRIARDLQEETLRDVTHLLAETARARVSGVGPGATTPPVDVVGVMRRVGQQLRSAIHELRLGGDEDRPFLELVEDLVAVQQAAATDASIDLHVREGVVPDSLGPRGTEVLRILGEALANARRHSGARRITVEIRSLADGLHATVADDGRGFVERATDTDRHGLRAMRERADLAGARLEILSEVGLGTEVRLHLPLAPWSEGPSASVRVLLVEDHASVREAIAGAFEREAGFEIVGQAASLAEARGLLRDVDVAVIDLGLPDGYGGDLVKELRQLNHHAQALVLSATLDRADVARAVEHGAAGVLDKVVHLDEVVNAVRRLHAGEMLLPMEEIVALLRHAGRQREQEAADRAAIEQLTPRELELLQALAEGLDGGAIAERLHISRRTERNHFTNILNKLGVHSRLQALVLALRYDVVRITQPPPIP
jgi:PAS domain S-box-containing protein